VAYREQGLQVEAPMKETLAAAVLTLAGWSAIAAPAARWSIRCAAPAPLPIEAALMAADIAPGLLRTRWGFERWLGHDEAAGPTS